MAFFGKLTNSDKKIESIERYESLRKRYEILIEKSNSAIENLYSKRKEGAALIDLADRRIRTAKDVSANLVESIIEAHDDIRQFEECISKEHNFTAGNYASTSGKTSSATMGIAAGATVGTAIATLGPTAAMAVATTFGTAATGTAISALTGVAASNAALAWLGGGAIAIGGGGMAAGSALLAMAGPIGIIVGGGIAAGGVFKARSRNNKIAEEINKQCDDIEKKCRKIENCLNRIKSTTASINAECKSLSAYLEHQSPVWSKVVEAVIKIVALINLRFSI